MLIYVDIDNTICYNKNNDLNYNNSIPYENRIKK